MATGTAAVIALVIVNVLSMVTDELIPKNATLSNSTRAAGLVASFLTDFITLPKPLIILPNSAANAVLYVMGVGPAEGLSGTRSVGGLASLVCRSTEEGTLSASTATLLTCSIGLGALIAVDIMTDHGRLHTLDVDDSTENIVHLARVIGHSRFPIIGCDIDDVMGIVHLRRAIGVPYERHADVPVASTSLMAPVPRVPETMPPANLLVGLYVQGSQMAIAVDGYGSTTGVATLEDAAREVIGDVVGEHDRRRTSAHLDPSGHWVVSGWMCSSEFATRAAIQALDDGLYETLGGLVTARLGCAPTIDDVVDLPHTSPTVDAMDGRHVTRLHVRSKDLEIAPGGRGPEGERR